MNEQLGFTIGVVLDTSTKLTAMGLTDSVRHCSGGNHIRGQSPDAQGTEECHVAGHEHAHRRRDVRIADGASGDGPERIRDDPARGAVPVFAAFGIAGYLSTLDRKAVEEGSA